MRFRLIQSREDVVSLVEEIGFLPFFSNLIPGFSIEENIAPEYWFSAERDGPWEWKGPIARERACAYGKLFMKKAGFVALDWFPDLANYRRAGYDFDARFDDAMAPYADKRMMDYLALHGPCLSRELRRAGNYKKGGNAGFDTVMTRLQMQTYVTVQDFVYERDAFGRPYGWGVAQYAASEARFGEACCAGAYDRAPEESLARIVRHLRRVLPDVDEAQILRLMR